MFVRPSDRLLATFEGRYWSFTAASRTRSLICASTVERPFITRETVARDTPAASATSEIVAAVCCFAIFGTRPP
ncbi:hypothetical protein GCM10025865_06600 [Paraoerskovia sediminicola]|uniref:Uncharacterized protein n=1 Tax=Paraoerskovia sediminicola TaxID=1138587 RepID=A0ABM8FZU6_9CELL|nr:hypothetical protein GCM10025865_06600 [Paraoerskovia sediminicola]